MKYVLVNKFDEIVDTVELAGNVGKTGATTYFQGVKKYQKKKIFINCGRYCQDENMILNSKQHYKTGKLNGGKKKTLF